MERPEKRLREGEEYASIRKRKFITELKKKEEDRGGEFWGKKKNGKNTSEKCLHVCCEVN